MSREKTLLRFATAGSVDDGKSTLIGRLLFEIGSVHKDHLEAVERVSKKMKRHDLDYSLLLDGLSAEREQGITIDVAYRHFSTNKRRFIIADVPGHEQYTKNMVTGVSNADCVVLVIDATKGVTKQTKRHLVIASLLGVPHILAAVNKMDLVSYNEDVFESVRDELEAFAQKLMLRDLQIMPVSALHGGMLVERGDRMPWYQGRTFLDYLERLYVSADRNYIDLRLPVQMVIRPNSGFRGYAGLVESGVIKKNDEVMIVPSAKRTAIKEVYSGFNKIEKGTVSESIVITLTDDVDVSRGDMIVHAQNVPEITHRFEAMICWLDELPLNIDTSYIIKHTTKTTRALIAGLRYRLNIDTLHKENGGLELNDIGRVQIATHEKLCLDSYAKNRSTGSFILIDPDSNATVAAGLILFKTEQLEIEENE